MNDKLFYYVIYHNEQLFNNKIIKYRIII